VRDWNVYARAHLNSLRLAPAQKEEIALELGEHLEEFYAALRSRGVTEEQAFSETCAQVGKWKELCDGIFAATKEVSMFDRIKRIWIPAAVTFIFAHAALMFLTSGPWTHQGETHSLVFYLPWFLVLPFVGGASAYMSRHARGDGWSVYFAASFPALAVAAVFLVFFAVVVAMNPQRLNAHPASLLAMLFDWAVLPGFALCVGGALQGLLARGTSTT